MHRVKYLQGAFQVNFCFRSWYREDPTLGRVLVQNSDQIPYGVGGGRADALPSGAVSTTRAGMLSDDMGVNDVIPGVGTVRESSGQLVFIPARPHLAGTYICVANNSAGVDTYR